MKSYAAHAARLAFGSAPSCIVALAVSACACGGMVDEGGPNGSGGVGVPVDASTAGGAGSPGGGTSGGAGSTSACPAPGGFGAAGSYLDAPGDVLRTTADVLEAAAYVADGVIDLRVRFADDPLPPYAAGYLWCCFDFTQDKLVGPVCATSTWVIASYVPGASPAYSLKLLAADGGELDLNPCEHVAYDACSMTLRILLAPGELPGQDGAFDYVLRSADSLDTNDNVPDLPLHKLTSISLESLPDFAGELSCDPPSSG